MIATETMLATTEILSCGPAIRISTGDKLHIMHIKATTKVAIATPMALLDNVAFLNGMEHDTSDIKRASAIDTDNLASCKCKPDVLPATTATR